MNMITPLQRQLVHVILIILFLITGTEQEQASFQRKIISFPEFDKERDEVYFEFSGKNTTIESRALQLTTDTTNDGSLPDHYNNSGRIMYYQPFRIHNGRIMGSFNSTFLINLFRESDWEAGHGLAFLISPNFTLPESSYGHWLGLTNSFSDASRDNHFVAIEFDTQNPGQNHIGLNINSVKSDKIVSLNDHNITLSLPSNQSVSYKVWVQYNGTSHLLQVFMDKQGEPKPTTPLLTQTINLKDFLKQESYFGFSASTGYPKIQLNCVLEWTLEIEVLPKKRDWKWLTITAGVAIPTAIVLLVLSLVFYVYKRRRRVEEPDHEYGNLRYLPGMPREFKYKELKKATNNFDQSMKLGEGGFGIVYKGTLQENCEIAVKKFSRDNIKSKGDFMAELAIIHRLRHKHLVRLVGWCYEEGKLLLVYDFMPNGSLEKHLYGVSEHSTLTWNHRYRILTGVASALYYLQNEYDQKVVHRDLKASNILVDADFNARLGDFGLARTIENERNSYAELGASGVPGTIGYVAPECFHTGKATPESDVYGFGAVVLEVVCGRNPGMRIPDEQHFYTLVDWVWMLHREGRIEDAVDERLENNFVVEEAKKVLLLGLACSHPLATERPKTEEILQIISGTLPAPYVPPFRPVFTWPSTDPATIVIDSLLAGITSPSQGYSSEKSSLSISQMPSAPSPSFNLPVSGIMRP
ncbi:hypothetical protein Ddye_004341 [Dipteronia dyeriana]|uniref:Protein kinase domain-containing protein n=1 Tax=Dipteronia dyeriana TaxID=168575 RepID=A0AAD9XUJ9_9ROSI|nr:hypothetical protein Ddye_004341 [Dipteronia dyeriana]